MSADAIAEARDLFDALTSEGPATGYLGVRKHMSERTRAATDVAALADARDAGMDDDDLAAWARGSDGREYGDVAMTLACFRPSARY